MDRLTAQGKAFATMAEAMYTDRCTIRRRITIKTADGGNSVTNKVMASNVPCRLSPSTAQERQIAGTTQGGLAYTVRMPYRPGTEAIILDSTCFLDIAAREDGPPAQTLHVVAPLPDSGVRIDAVAVRQS